MSALERSYIPSLDGLRAVAITIVFVSHAGLGAIVPGGFGVTLFFFLSGYLITRLMLREQHRTGSVSLRAFYVRRALRILPPFLVTFLLAVALAAAGLLEGELDPRVILAQLLFFSNYVSAILPEAESVAGLGILWSLGVEEHFYFLWPLIFLVIGRWRRGPQISALACGIGAILAWRLVRFHLMGTSEETIYLSSDTRFDSLLFGCLLALIEGGTLSRKAFGPLTILGVTMAALTLIVATFALRDPAFRATWRYTLQGLALMPIFHFAVHTPEFRLFSWLNWRPVRWIGTLSYGLYLVHLVALRGLQFHLGAQLSALQIGLLAALVAVVLAVFLHLWIERPFARLRATAHLERKKT